MAMPSFSMRQLLEAGVHFGHQTRRWNPRMAPYIFGDRNGVHILDLSQSVPLLHRAMQHVRDVVAGRGRVLFVGTKRQAQDPIAEAAKRSGQYYVNHRWLGGMLTNWKTISNSIRRLRELEAKLEEPQSGYTKKERLQLTREQERLERSLGGIKDMGGLPDLLIIVDTNKESLAIAEANNLKIPVIAILDSNSDPEGVDMPIPGNDDASRAINLYCDLFVGAILDGIQAEMVASGTDLGELEDMIEELPEDAAAEEAAAPATPEASAAPEQAAAPAEAAEAAPSSLSDLQAMAEGADSEQKAG